MTSSDFVEIVAAGWRPGLTRLGSEELVLSVSMPSFKLAEGISAQALGAWDARLLSASRHLTLLISGIRGVYPVLLPSGKIDPVVAARMNKLTFRVGLSPKYKPDKELVTGLVRTFGLRQQEPRVPQPIVPQDSSASASYDENGYHDDPMIHQNQWFEEEEEDKKEEESFGFSLSSSLEALFNDRFLEILQLRLAYGLGWAAAEAVSVEMHKAQTPAETILAEDMEVCVF